MNVTHCKTILVRYIEFGHEAYINAAEFDASVHERVAEAPAAAPVAPFAPVAPVDPPALGGAQPAGDVAPHAVHGMNADTAKEYAASLTSVDDIAAAQAAEYAHPRFPGGRTSVLKALDAAQSAALKVAANATEQ